MTLQKTLYIYKTTNNINGKIYIGQRSYNGDILKDSYLGSGIALKHAVKKYGKLSFSKEILEIVDRTTINDREIYWIDFYKARDKEIGYNIHEGGCMDVIAVSEKLIGVVKAPRNETYCKNISEAKLGDKNPMFGKPSPRARSLVQLAKDGTFIQEFDNSYIAAEAVNGNFSHISACCRGKRNTHMGFMWKFKEDFV